MVIEGRDTQTIDLQHPDAEINASIHLSEAKPGIFIS
jgi:hypothetical protein